MKENWRVWDKDKEYGDLFYKRAIGELPEMESSKSLAKKVNEIIQENDRILDVGCGAGHYLRSLDKIIKTNFSYTGIDQTAYYIERAKEAFSLKVNSNSLRSKTDFKVGDIFNIPVDDNKSDIVICNNVFLHLPSIQKPLEELIRVSKKYIIIRTLIGASSFRIKQVEQPESYDLNGEPINYHYYNIYSEGYIQELLENISFKMDFSFEDDLDYDPSAFGNSDNFVGKRPDDLTTSINGIQLNIYILQPWKFLIIEKK
ncbi:MAG: methyltransferase domain-containing protein [Bacteroidetes bacterium]|nr:methyltransferase domain-containing protein [Bacteroidota bacterium]